MLCTDVLDNGKLQGINRRERETTAVHNSKLILLRVVFVALTIGVIGVSGLLQHQLFVGELNGDAVEFLVATNVSVSEIGNLLAEKGIISHPALFQLYALTSGSASHLQAGLYSLYRGQSVASIVEMMADGQVIRDRFRYSLSEGSNILQAATRAEQQGFCTAEEFLHAIDQSQLRQAEEGILYPLEGYLYPATYTFDALPTPDELIRAIYYKAEEVYENLVIPEGFPLNLDEVIILASVLEKESQYDDERAIVASVFLNRLEIGMPLQSCASVQYVLPEFKEILSEEDTLVDSPYNTYINNGLPLGPISNPSLMALEAVLNPADTEYLFFVAGADGKHIFTYTYEEHLAAIGSITE